MPSTRATPNCQQLSTMTRSVQRLGQPIPRRLCTVRAQYIRILPRSLSAWTSPGARSPRNPLALNVPQISRGYAKVVSSPETKAISQTEYDLRRTRLMDLLPNGSTCVLVGAAMKYSSDSVLYVSDFSRLTVVTRSTKIPTFST